MVRIGRNMSLKQLKNDNDAATGIFSLKAIVVYLFLGGII